MPIREQRIEKLTPYRDGGITKWKREIVLTPIPDPIALAKILRERRRKIREEEAAKQELKTKLIPEGARTAVILRDHIKMMIIDPRYMAGEEPRTSDTWAEMLGCSNQRIKQHCLRNNIKPIERVRTYEGDRAKIAFRRQQFVDAYNERFGTRFD